MYIVVVVVARSWKHHSGSSSNAANLLVRLFSITESRFSPASTRAALIALVKSRIGYFRLDEAAVANAIEKLRTDSDWTLEHALLPAVREVLHSPNRHMGTLQINVTLRVSESDARIQISNAPLGHLIAIQTLFLVRGVGRDSVPRCGCGRRFVKVGKRSNCSTACQKRFYMRKFRAGAVGTME